MNAEDNERGIDAQFRHSDIIHRTALWDSTQDYRSEARYDDGRPDIEPEPPEPGLACIVDESAGFRG